MWLNSQFAPRSGVHFIILTKLCFHKLLNAATTNVFRWQTKKIFTGKFLISQIVCSSRCLNNDFCYLFESPVIKCAKTIHWF